jgi:hypothetical protein
MTDEEITEKDAECVKRTGFKCVRIPQTLYDAAVAKIAKDGIDMIDMRNYVVQKMMPTGDTTKAGYTFGVWSDRDDR